MADDKNARDKQARDEDNRQRERAIETALARGGESEPPIVPADLDYIENELTDLEYPVTGTDVVTTVGDREIESTEWTYKIRDLVPDTDTETYAAPTEIRERIEQPTVATAMKQIVEASESLQHASLRESQGNAYQKTLQELAAIDADDDDEGIRIVGDWIVDQIHEKETLPDSRAVRRKAAKYCRANDYEIRIDEWLGI
jgi:hypothetical protein